MRLMKYRGFRVTAMLTVASAQVLLAQTGTSPAARDTPSIKVGATLFADASYTTNPSTVDADSNQIHFSQFNVTRAYINVTGNVSHLIGFRITPDIVRENGAGSTLNGSLTFRLKYAFGQLNLDDWLSKGSWVRLGIQQTPWIDFTESIYRYRFQGSVFADREGYLSASDAGLAAHYNLPGDYGDIHAGVYNGETYSRAEVNDQKALQVRASLRPFPTGAVIRGLRATVFYDADHYVADAPRRRLIGALTFSHQYLNAGFEYLKTEDRTSSGLPSIEGHGYSVFATPATSLGLAALLRYDHLIPDETLTLTRERFIGGVAYWFPHVGSVSSAVMLDYETTRFKNTNQPDQNRLSLHTLVSF